MWRAGEEGSVIAAKFGVATSYIFDIAAKYRHDFPHRNKRLNDDEVRSVAFIGDIPHHCMHWVTETGSHVTLPKISMAVCPRVQQ